MFNRILVPLDGSAFAEAALPAAFTLARQSNGEVRLVCALEPIADDPGFSAFDAADRESAARYLAKVKNIKASGSNGMVSTSLRTGHAVAEIAAEAKEWGADVIVMATHGRSGLSRAWMGSVADRCIRTAKCPVLAVHPTESGAARELATKQVVVPLDGSPLAEAALPYGVALAKHCRVPLVLLEALTLPPFVDPSYLPESIIDRSSQVSAYLKGHLNRLRGEGVDVTESVVADKSVAHAILDRAEGDLVVMSTHGRTGLDRAFFGSVADKVIRGATGSVLVIPAQGSLRPVGVTDAYAVAYTGQ
jgi:nucleotide-binding universal stress UspA family protein